MACCNLTRLTARLRARVKQHVEEAANVAVLRDEFVWLRTQDPACWNAVRVGANARDVESIAPEEVAAATVWVLSRSLSMQRDDAIKETARRFGIQRVGGRVTECITAGLEVLVQRGWCACDGERVTWQRPQ